MRRQGSASHGAPARGKAICAFPACGRCARPSGSKRNGMKNSPIMRPIPSPATGEIIVAKSTTAERHFNAIADGRVTKSNVIGIRKAINHVERLRAGYSGNRSSVTPDQAAWLERALADREPHVVGELHESGLKLLRSPRYRKRWNEA